MVKPDRHHRIGFMVLATDRLRHSKNTNTKHFKSAKVMKTRKELKNCRRPKETKETLNVLKNSRLDPGTKATISVKH